MNIETDFAFACIIGDSLVTGAHQLARPPKAWALLRFWVSILFCKKKTGRILGLVWLKFAVGQMVLKHPMGPLKSPIPQN